MPDMMHLDLFLCFATHTAGFSQFGAGSEADQGSHHVHVLLVSSLKGQSVFRPVSVEMKTDLAICFSSLPFDEKGEVLPKALKYLWDGEFVFLRQRLCKREFQDVLNAGALFPVVYKAVVVLKTTIDAAVELDDLICIQ